ncbi:MAG: hypothetical protein AAGB12_15410 [Pseudomonadota bacterium]
MSDNFLSELKEVLDANCFHTQIGNIDGVLDTLHKSNPTYTQSQKTLEALFAKFKFIVEVISFHFIGKHNEYAYVRSKQKVDL